MKNKKKKKLQDLQEANNPLTENQKKELEELKKREELNEKYGKYNTNKLSSLKANVNEQKVSSKMRKKISETSKELKKKTKSKNKGIGVTFNKILIYFEELLSLINKSNNYNKLSTSIKVKLKDEYFGHSKIIEFIKELGEKKEIENSSNSNEQKIINEKKEKVDKVIELLKIIEKYLNNEQIKIDYENLKVAIKNLIKLLKEGKKEAKSIKKEKEITEINIKDFIACIFSRLSYLKKDVVIKVLKYLPQILHEKENTISCEEIIKLSNRFNLLLLSQIILHENEDKNELKNKIDKFISDKLILEEPINSIFDFKRITDIETISCDLYLFNNTQYIAFRGFSGKSNIKSFSKDVILKRIKILSKHIDFTNYIDKPVESFFITGHGSGGSIASLFFTESNKFEKLSNKFIDCVTFGELKCYNQDLIKKFNKVVEKPKFNYRRYINKKDLFAHMASVKIFTIFHATNKRYLLKNTMSNDDINANALNEIIKTDLQKPECIFAKRPSELEITFKLTDENKSQNQGTIQKGGIIEQGAKLSGNAWYLGVDFLSVMKCYNSGLFGKSKNENKNNSSNSTTINKSLHGGGATKKTRKAPKEFAKNCRVGIIKKGIDGSDWKVYKRKNGIKSWKRV